MTKRYPGIGIIGSEMLSGIYGMNEGIVDAKGTGIQHLFYDTFDLDLIHSACTLVKVGDTLYYGNRKETRSAHQSHMHPTVSEIREGFIMTDIFDMDSNHLNPHQIQIANQAFGYEDAKLGFEMSLLNKGNKAIDIEVYTYLILRNSAPISARIIDNQVISKIGDTFIGVKTNTSKAYLIEESPTGFLYRTTNAVHYDEKATEPLETSNMVGVLIGHPKQIMPNETYAFKWGIIFGKNEGTLQETLESYEIDTAKEAARAYWKSYLNSGYTCENKTYEDLVNINQIAIKSATIKGFVPADLTGHYFSEGLPSYYARDSMMVARAFLLSGHLKEAKEVICYLLARKRKASGEFYQRYNGIGMPSEGANNSVFHQLDSIGYFMKNIYDYYKLTGELLIHEADIKSLMDALLNCEKKKGMVGPEGGVNEGVYGPAFITSSNMFIYGGIKASIALLEDEHYKARLKDLNQNIFEGIESTYLEGEGYQYGYVNYHDDLVKKYDTPVYFGLLYGFENTENMKQTHQYLLKNAAYHKDGIGYSEQEYHHGPWIFNTAACAEYAFLNQDFETYEKKYHWITQHSNRYGLMPEAISADDENQCFINPLIWPCAEFVSASFIHKDSEIPFELKLEKGTIR
ncbi:hypothetical protein [Fusibacter ferrireducens]|uniref:Uncharacterized protein n=1 Tax=Fusibacter ferrireducens TaxID=2785058 RepID=A0ABR9ZPB3_9FIRM|nr:hypothetical protein [Fusibacter ferrireducens]MBF4691968.1 hypothetical protein [Fusibacter ferrireducens]